MKKLLTILGLCALSAVLYTSPVFAANCTCVGSVSVNIAGQAAASAAGLDLASLCRSHGGAYSSGSCTGASVSFSVSSESECSGMTPEAALERLGVPSSINSFGSANASCSVGTGSGAATATSGGIIKSIINEDLYPPTGSCGCPGGGFSCEETQRLVCNTRGKCVPPGQPNIESPIPCNYSLEDILGTALRVANFIFGIIGSLMLLMFVYGGFQMLTAFGNNEKIQAGQKTLTAAVIGAIIVLSAAVIIRFVAVKLLQVPVSGGTDLGTITIQGGSNSNP